MKIKLVSPNASHAHAWSAEVRAAHPGIAIETLHGTLAQVDVVADGSRADLVIVEVLEAAEFDRLEALAHAMPELDFLLIGPPMSPDLLMRAMRAGVREVLPSPASAATVAEAVNRLARKRPRVVEGTKRGQVVTFIGCKGGSGATFTATNVAHLLATGDRKVALIDLNLQFGDALLFISNDQPMSHVADVARNVQRLDAALLGSSMTQLSRQLHVLPAPEDVAQAADVLPEHVNAIVSVARTMYDVVVIDVGRALSGVTLQALDEADHVYAVLQMTLPFVRDARRLRDVFRSLEYPQRKLHWVVNRYEKNSQITTDDLRTMLGTDELITLPNQYQVVADSVNQGMAVGIVAPNSPIAKALRGIAERIAPDAQPVRARWFSGLLRGQPSLPSPSRV